MRTYKTDIIFSALDELSALKYCQETAQKTAVIQLTKAVLSEYPTETENSKEAEALKYVTKAKDILNTPKMNETFLCWCLENALSELLIQDIEDFAHDKQEAK